MSELDETTLRIMEAISVRDEVDKGLRDQEWIRLQIVRMVEEGFWNPPQIAKLTGYARQSISKIAADAVRPAERPAGGSLAAGALDLLLELRGAVLGQREVNAALVQAAIRTGTSTKLISRLTGVGLGAVLYQQRKMSLATEENS